MNPNSQSILVYAARYAHTRNTGAALQVVNEILKHWDSLSANTKEQLKREAKNETLHNKEDWKLIVDKPLQSRPTNEILLKAYENNPRAWKRMYCKINNLSSEHEPHWGRATNEYDKMISKLESDGEIK